ncbi:MAG: RNB domain-containing ribonuclease [Treponema sp.]|jgi:exoribonuclease-2|nr:RNB domain-containing ribonuclease [Treponema sp.]
MIKEDALVAYKNKPALVKECPDGKYSIVLQNGEQLKVREKDIELLHPGPVKNFNGIATSDIAATAVRETWELLLDEDGAPVSLKDLASLIFGEYTQISAYAAFCLLQDGLYFSGGVDAIVPRGKDEVTAEETKRGEKQRESGERSSFLERLKACYKNPSKNHLLPDDARFLQDVEALAFGKSAKSRTMRDLGLTEGPEDAHALLLNTGFWKTEVNPHPVRFGIPLTHVSDNLRPPSAEDRRDLTSLAAFAIDSPWSSDPDDAVSIEHAEEGRINLYVHVSDPAASITFDSPAEKEARDRGATLYIPEDTIRMLADAALPLFALGLSDKSSALTYKMTLDANGEIIDTDIFPSVVKVCRLTYEAADRLMSAASSGVDSGTDSTEVAALRALYDLAERNLKRRLAAGAVSIDLPEVHIGMEDGKPVITPIIPYRSVSLVRECMLIAGEGSGSWAAGNGIIFPYISQEVEMQGDVPSGMAGSYQLRRCMRPRTISTKPGRHWGLGLETYTQVTSPLRRYTDLLAHLQIRAFLRGGKPLAADEVSARLGAGEAAAAAVTQAERASRNHWTMVYLCSKKDSVWDAVALEKKGSRWAVIIPALALETQVPLQKDVSPNENIKLILKSVNISRGEAVFVSA